MATEASLIQQCIDQLSFVKRALLGQPHPQDQSPDLNIANPTWDVEAVQQLKWPHATADIWRQPADESHQPGSNAQNVCPQTLRNQAEHKPQTPTAFLHTLERSDVNNVVDADVTPVEDASDFSDVTAGAQKQLYVHLQTERRPNVRYDGETMYECTFMDRVLKPLLVIIASVFKFRMFSKKKFRIFDTTMVMSKNGIQGRKDPVVVIPDHCLTSRGKCQVVMEVKSKFNLHLSGLTNSWDVNPRLLLRLITDAVADSMALLINNNRYNYSVHQVCYQMAAAQAPIGVLHYGTGSVFFHWVQRKRSDLGARNVIYTTALHCCENGDNNAYAYTEFWYELLRILEKKPTYRLSKFMMHKNKLLLEDEYQEQLQRSQVTHAAAARNVPHSQRVPMDATMSEPADAVSGKAEEVDQDDESYLQKKWLPHDHPYWEQAVAAVLRAGGNYAGCANRVGSAAGPNGEHVIVKAFVSNCDEQPEERDREMEHWNEVHAYSRLQSVQNDAVPEFLGWMRSVVNDGDSVDGENSEHEADEVEVPVVLLSHLPGKTLFECTDHERSNVRRAVLAAFQKIWDCGVVHGDPRLQNVLVCENKVYVIDFGHSFLDASKEEIGIERKAVEALLPRESDQSLDSVETRKDDVAALDMGSV